MRTNIEIDDKLLRQAMKVTGSRTKKAAVEAAMRLTVRMKQQERIRKLFGKIQWEGDLAAMRESRFLDEDGFHRRPEGWKGPERTGLGLSRPVPSRPAAD